MTEGSARTILNVNDDEAILYAKSRILTRAGYRVLEARTGAEALRVAAANLPELVLLDVRLPDIPGTEVCRRLKSNPETARIMVLHISAGEIGSQAKAAGLEGGADGYLTEPVEANELVASVNALLRLHAREVENRRLVEQLRQEMADRKQTERQLQDTEQRYRLIAEMAHQGMWLMDHEGRTLFANRRMAEMLGCSRDELEAKSLYDFCFPDDVVQARERIASNIQGGAEQFDFRFRRRDGSPVLVLGESCPLQDGTHHSSGALAVFADITARKQAEERLRESRERLQYALDSADLVAWDWSPDSDVVIQSANASRVLGLSYGATLRSAKEYFDMIHAEDQPRVVAAIQRALREGKDYHEEFRLVLNDGSVRWVADRGRVTVNDNGKAARMNGVIRDITELKMREMALRESEARFRATFNQAAVGMCLISPEGHLLQVNQRLCTLLGEEPEGLMRRRLLDLTHADDRTHNQRSMSRLLLGGVPDVSIEQRLVRRDGTPVWVSMYLALLWDAGGRLEHVIGVIQDIDERKRAEEALQYQLTLNKIITDNTPSLLFMMDAEGRGTFINPAMEEITGYRRDELIGRVLHDKIHHTKPDGTRCAIETCQLERALRAPDGFVGHEDLFVRKDGTFFPVRCSSRPILQDGALIGTVVDVQDITSQKQAEEALKESESRFRNMADTAPAMLWKTDASGSCTFLSRGWYEFTGRTPEMGLGHGWFGAIHDDDRERVQHRFQEATDRRLPFSLDYRLRRADGAYRWASDSGRPRFSPKGEFEGYIGSVIDITDRKQAEEQLQLLNLDLERRVVERTRELVHSQNRLRKLASDLSIAEERERRRVAGELHDYLAQLLVATRMKLSHARQGRAGVRQADVLAEVDLMLDQSLTYTRTLVAQLSPPVLHEFGLAAALKWLGEQMPRHGLQVSTSVTAEPLVISENQAVLLFQSARELLLNVVKHAGTDRATLQLESRGGELRLTVSDEGRGFDSVAVKETSASSNTFGLFSIRERMESLGGRVELTSHPERGTRVRLLLPLVDEKAEPAAGLQPAASRHSAKTREEPRILQEVAELPHSKLRVVLVDDHAMVRQGLRSLLESHRDVEVVAEAGDGLQAIRLTESLRPDVVVMDLSLPSLDGVEATRRICRSVPGTVVIGLSVHQSRQIEQAIRTAGAAAFLTKECAVDQLYEAMSSAMMARSS